MTGFIEFPFVEVLEIGGWCRDYTHAARRLTRFSGPGHYCSANHPKWSGWQELHLRPPRSEQGRLLLTLHPENGCQTWTRTKTSGLTGRRATLTPPGNGAAGRTSTCIVPLSPSSRIRGPGRTVGPRLYLPKRVIPTSLPLESASTRLTGSERLPKPPQGLTANPRRPVRRRVPHVFGHDSI